MLKLSRRLKAIADFIQKGESIADIGTDHALLPIYLWQKGICPRVILSDVKWGPINKARKNIARYAPKIEFDIRVGDGLSIIEAEEVDAVILAGMGGLVIINILKADMTKTKSIKKLVFQPRKNKELLGKWLLDNSFAIVDEALVKEGRNICEILVAIPIPIGESQKYFKLYDSYYNSEISPILLGKEDPLLPEFISRKILIEQKIGENLHKACNSSINKAKLNEVENRLIRLKGFLKSQ